MNVSLMGAYTQAFRPPLQNAQYDSRLQRPGLTVPPVVALAAQVGKVNQKIQESGDRTRADVAREVEQLSAARPVSAEAARIASAMYSASGATAMGLQSVGFYINTHA